MKNLKFVVLSLVGIFFLSAGFAQSPASKKKINNPSTKSIEAATKATDALNAKLMESVPSLQLSAEQKEAIKNLHIERIYERIGAIKNASSKEEKKQINKDLNSKYNKMIQANHLTSAQQAAISGKKKMPKATTVGTKKGNKASQNLANRAKKQLDILEQKMLLGDPETKKLSAEQKTILQEQILDRSQKVNSINKDASLSAADKKAQIAIVSKAANMARKKVLSPEQFKALNKGHQMGKAKK